MISLLQQLENNEAILLMYLAGELPADDRAEVEQMLAVDGNLRSELERLETTYRSVMTNLGELDATLAVPVSQAVTVRQVSRAMKQWQVDWLTKRHAVVPAKGLRYPWWVYPSVSAAAIVLAMVTWWGLKSDDTTYKLGPIDQSVALQSSFTDSEQANGNIPNIEQQASALKTPTDEDASIFMTAPQQQQ